MATSLAAKAASIRSAAENWFGRIYFGQTGIKSRGPRKIEDFVGWPLKR